MEDSRAEEVIVGTAMEVVGVVASKSAELDEIGVDEASGVDGAIGVDETAGVDDAPGVEEESGVDETSGVDKATIDERTFDGASVLEATVDDEDEVAVRVIFTP